MPGARHWPQHPAYFFFPSGEDMVAPLPVAWFKLPLWGYAQIWSLTGGALIHLHPGCSILNWPPFSQESQKQVSGGESSSALPEGQFKAIGSCFISSARVLQGRTDSPHLRWFCTCFQSNHSTLCAFLTPSEGTTVFATCLIAMPTS